MRRSEAQVSSEMENLTMPSTFSRDVALVVLGAGLSNRYGIVDKLGDKLGSKPVSHHLLDSVDGLEFGQKILVSRSQSWTKEYGRNGFDLIENTSPELGMSHSLGLAISAASKTNFILVCLADMPLVPRPHLEAILETASKDGAPVVTAGLEYKGPPALFSIHHLRRLKLRGDVGAKGLLRDSTTVFLNDALLQDIDREDDLLRAKSYLERTNYLS